MTVLEPFVSGLRRYVARRVPVADVDDVSQEIFLRLHRRANTLRDPERIEAWVFGIARRTIADHFRLQYKRQALETLPPELPDESTTAPAGFAPWGTDEVHEEVLSWLRPIALTLPAAYRDALLLADFERLPQREVARRLGLSVSGAKSRVQRARQMLGERVRGCCEVELNGEGRAVDYRPNEECCESDR